MFFSNKFRTPEENTQDVILINGLLYVAKTLHDSISALTFDDEKRQISELILGFIKRVFFFIYLSIYLFLNVII